MNNNKLDSILQKITNGEISLQNAYSEIISPNNATLDTLFLTPKWIEKELTINDSNTFSDLVIYFGNKTNNNYKYLSKNKGLASEMLLVSAGKKFHRNDENEFETSINAKDFEKLFDHFENHLTNDISIIIDWIPEYSNDVENLEKLLQYCFYTLFYITREAINRKLNKSIRILFVQDGVSQQINPIFEAVFGLAKSIQIEKSNIQTKLLRIQKQGIKADELLDICLNEFNDTLFSIEQIKYSNDARFVNSLHLNNSNIPATTTFLSKDGVYLITGGAGKIGLCLAEHIANECESSTIVLVGRSQLNEEAKAKIAIIKETCKNIIYQQTDISKTNEIKELKKIIEKFGKLNGIIHSAGVTKDSFLPKKTTDEIKDVFAPKIQATILLDKLFNTDTLDFVVLFSSIVSHYGNIGQCDYAFANAFLNSFATFRNNQLNRSLYKAIAWPLWTDGGMQLDEELLKLNETAFGIIPMTNIVGMQVFNKALNLNEPECYVLHGEKEKILESLINTKTEVEKVVHPSALNEQEKLEFSGVENLYDDAALYIKRLLVKETAIPEHKLDDEASFDVFGIDSIMTVKLTQILESNFGKLSKTLFFECQTINELTIYFIENHNQKLQEIVGGKTPKQEPKVEKTFENPQKQNIQNKKKSRLKKSANQKIYKNITEDLSLSHTHQQNTQPIAITGISGRYPMADNLDEFWVNLVNGVDAITEIPKERWDNSLFFHPDKEKEGTIYSKWGGFMNDVDKFDSLFFNISPREAEIIDPQERIFLETVWHALEDGGYTRKQLTKEQVGVYVGVMYSQYQLLGAEENMKGNRVTPGSFYASIANRISYYFDLQGPSMALDTMCSSSLTAIHLACQSIANGETSMAIAGGINLSIHPMKYLFISSGKFAASDGRCRSFGEGGDGYVPGEGVGAIILKPLDKALRDGDHIYGKILTTAINHGGKTSGYTVPNPKAQTKLISSALSKANVNAHHISYIEAHGTGTSLGDPIEINGLSKAFSEHTTDKGFCAIGSIKSNIGHLESAAGISGITKVLLQMKNKKLVPSLHSDILNKNIEFENTPFVVQHDYEDWKQPIDASTGKTLPRIAGLSSFGAGGANAHIIIEEHENELHTNSIENGSFLFVLSAKKEEILKNYAQDLIDFFDTAKTSISPEQENAYLQSVNYTLLVGREHFNKRLAFRVSTIQDLQSKLKLYVENENSNEIHIDDTDNQKNKTSLLLQGEEGKLFMQLVYENKNYDKLASLWVTGIDIEWEKLYGDHLIQKMSLPVYPFQRERFWITKENNASDLSLPYSQESNIHPIIKRNISTLHEFGYVANFSVNIDLIKDHEVNEIAVAPGALLIELALVAARMSKLGNRGLIKNIHWLQPLLFTDDIQHQPDTKIGLQLIPEKELVEFTIYQEVGATKKLFAKGEFDTNETDNPKELIIDLASLKNRCTESMDADSCYKHMQENGIQYYDSYRSINSIVYNQQEVLSELILPEHLNANAESFILHPALLDGAFQSILPLVLQKKLSGTYLPVSIGKLFVYKEIPSEAFTHAEIIRHDNEQLFFNFTILSKTGEIVAEIEDFVARKINKSTISNPIIYSDILFVNNQWKEDVVEKNSNTNKNILIVDYSNILNNSDKANCIILKNGKKVEKKSNSLFLADFNNQHQIELVLDSILENVNVLSDIAIWVKPTINSEFNFTETLQFFSTVANVYKAVNTKLKKCKLGVFSNSIHNIHEHNAVMGFAKSTYLENSNIVVSNFTIENEIVPANILDIAAEKMQEKYFAKPTEIHITSEKQSLRVLSEVQIQRGITQIEFRNGGVYIISGGAGEIGLTLANHLAQKTNLNIVLLGRSVTLSAEKQKRVKEIANSTSSNIIYKSCDIADSESVRNVLYAVKNELGSISGIIHSAGVVKDSLFVNKSTEEIEQVLSPKIRGLENLDELTKSEPLDFFVVFSSAASVMGNYGQADYAFANSYLDSYALSRNELTSQGKCSGISVSINWPYWKDGGMDVDSDIIRWMEQKLGIVPIDNKTAINIFDLILNAGLSQIMVLKGDKDKIRTQLFATEKVKKQEFKKVDLAPSVDVTSKLKKYLANIFSEQFKLDADRINHSELFEAYGIDSVMVMSITRKLEEKFGDLPKTLLFEFQSIDKLSGYFIKSFEQVVQDNFGSTNAQVESTIAEPINQIQNIVNNYSSFSLNGFKKRNNTVVHKVKEIAIVGLGGKYPQADTIEEFWNNLSNGKDCIEEIPFERWNKAQYYSEDKNKIGKIYGKWGGFLKDIKGFDPLFFNISPREAKMMDPQERLFLETAYHTFENAGYTTKQLENEKVGVYVGVMYGHYQMYNNIASSGQIPNSQFSAIPNRVSFHFNFSGPSMAIDTMCSSSVTSIHLACKSIINGDCTVALAGGVNVSVHPHKYQMLSYGKFLSTDGRCRSFGDGGDGYVPGEGVGAVMLKSLEKAIEDGDYIYGTIKGSALNHGGKGNGFTVPSPNAQHEVIKNALNQSGIKPEDISYIEAHGTGTELGDPIEIRGLQKEFESVNKTRKISIGSVKSNVGHLESAAGIAGLTKILLQLQHKKLVPSLHSKNLNSNINFSDTPFQIQQETENWNSDTLRTAALSSFGAGGSNGHIIIQENPSPSTRLNKSTKKPQLLVISAKKDKTLHEYIQLYYSFINNNYPDQKQTEHQDGAFQEFAKSISEILAETLDISIEDISLDETLEDLGFDNVLVTRVASNINDFFEINISGVELSLSYTGNQFTQNIYENWNGKIKLKKGNNSDLEIENAIDQNEFDNFIYTLQIGREEYDYRFAAIVSDFAEAKEKLKAFIENNYETDSLIVTGNSKEGKENLSLLIGAKNEKSLIGKLINEENIKEIGEIWVNGGDVNWAGIYKSQQRKRMPLPVYPFDKKVYWISENGHVANSQQADLVATNSTSCLIDGVDIEHTVSNNNLTYYKELNPNDLVLKDHVVMNRKILPGVGYLEMAYSCFKEVYSDKQFKLSDVTLMQSIEVTAEPLKVRVEIVKHKEYYGFLITSTNKSGNKTIHCQGKVFDYEHKKPKSLDINNLFNKCQEQINVNNFYNKFNDAGVIYGDYFKRIVKLYSSSNSAVAELHLDNQYVHELLSYSCHPALMDSAVQAIAAININHAGERSLKLPFSIEELIVHNNLESKVFAFVDEISENRYNVNITSLSGNLLIEFKALTLREISSKKQPFQSYYIQNKWEKIKIKPGEADLTKKVLVVYNKYAQQLADTLCSSATKSSIKIDKVAIEERGSIDNISPFISEKEKIDEIVYLGGTYFEKTEKNELVLFHELQETGVVSLFKIVKLLDSKGYTNHKLHLKIITNNCFSIIQNETNNSIPLGSEQHGFAKSLAKEFVRWKISSFDVDREDFKNNQARLISTLISLPDTKGEEWLVRENEFYKRELYAIDSNNFDLSNANTYNYYVIIGGGSGIGYAYANYLCHYKNANVSIIGRRQKNSELSEKIENLNKKGGKATYYSCDISDLNSLKETFNKIAQDQGGIDVIVHSAIVLEDRTILNMNEETLRKVMMPKTTGIANLSIILDEHKISQMILFSSAQSISGNAGQSNYAAACTFEDVFGNYLGYKHNLNVKIINWGFWGDVGIVATPEYTNRLAKQGIQPITTKEGMLAIEKITASNHKQLMYVKLEKTVAEKMGITIEKDHAESVATSFLLDELNSIIIGNCNKQELIQESSVSIDNLEEFAISKVVSVCRKSGLLNEASISKMEFKQSLTIKPKYTGLVDAIFNTLITTGCVYTEDGMNNVNTTYQINHYIIDEIANDVERFEKEFSDNYAELRSNFILIEHCINNLFDVLQGTKQPVDVLFPNSSAEMVESVYKGNKVADYYNQTTAISIATILEETINQHPDNTVRILEIGAGTGSTTTFILDEISRCHKSVEYIFTDLSGSLVQMAKKKFGKDYPFVQFKVLNIEESIKEQNETQNSYDIVVAANVLHATKDINVTMHHAKTLLKPQGALLINEVTERKNYLTYTFGLLDGWWLASDKFRIPQSPLLSVENWENVLDSNGFVHFNNITKEHVNVGQSVMIAYSNGEITIPMKSNTKKIDSVEPGIYENTKDELPVVNKQTVPKSNSQSSLAEIKMYLIQKVSTVIVDSLEMDTEVVDGNRQFSDYGIDSITGVEIINRLNTDLNLSLKTTVLFDYSSLNELVKYLFENFSNQITIPTNLANNQDEEYQSQTTVKVSVIEPEDNGVSKKELIEKIVQSVASALDITVSEVEIDRSFSEYGVDSIIGVELINSINADLGIVLKTTDLFDYNNILELTQHIIDKKMVENTEELTNELIETY